VSVEKCTSKTKAQKIKFEEKRRRATFLNPEKKEYTRTRFDGCVVKDAVAADWVLSKKNVGDVILELKGRNVEHAFKQVLSTARYWATHDLSSGRLSALIVCRQFPNASTKVQRAKASFNKSFKGPLHIVSHNSDFVFENVLSAKGPYRK